MVAVGELSLQLEQCRAVIQDFEVPPGMSEYQIADYLSHVGPAKAQLRSKISAIESIEQRIRARCLNYVIGVERQLEAQGKARHFLTEAQTVVNNYFKAHSEDVFTKLQRASQLINTSDPEDYSLLLTQVRRAIKSAVRKFFGTLGPKYFSNPRDSASVSMGAIASTNLQDSR